MGAKVTHCALNYADHHVFGSGATFQSKRPAIGRSSSMGQQHLRQSGFKAHHSTLPNSYVLDILAEALLQVQSDFLIAQSLFC